MSSTLLSARAAVARRSFMLSAVALLGAAEGASAQSSLTYWNHTAWKVEEGTRVTGLASNLRIEPSPGSNVTRVAALLPPAMTPGAPATVGFEFERLSLWGPTVPAGATVDVTAQGTLGGVPNQALSTAHIERLPNGQSRFSFDFAPTGATSVTVELYAGNTLVFSQPGLPIGVGGQDPWFIPDCPDPTGWCCTTGAIIWSPPFGWICVYPCLTTLEPWWLQGPLNVPYDRVAIIPEVGPIPFEEVTALAVATRDLPGVELRDLTLAGFAAIGASYCSANPNSTGQAGEITALGSGVAADNQLELHAFQLPQHAFGYFIVSPYQAFVPNVGGTQGNLCVGLSTGRFVSQLGNTGTQGYLSVHVDLMALPQPTGSVAVQAGQTWNFQCWHRDANPTTTSNFSSGYSILFR